MLKIGHKKNLYKESAIHDDKIVAHDDNESGRSMVEMLGVLAIIGVLSVMGIVGYRYSMDRFKVNEILDGLTKRAVLASQQRLRGDANVNLEGMPHKVNNLFPVEGRVPNKKIFVLRVSDLPKNVCETILSMDWDLPAKIADGNGVVLNQCNDGNNVVDFYFRNDLKTGSLLPEEEIACKEGEVWDNDKKACHESCSAGEVWDDGSCHVPCQPGEIWDSSCHCCHAGEVCQNQKKWNGVECACLSGTEWKADQNKCVCVNPKDTWDAKTLECVPSEEEGFIIVGKNAPHHRFLASSVSATNQKNGEAEKWCRDHGRHLATIQEACGMDPLPSGSCPDCCTNLSGDQNPNTYFWLGTDGVAGHVAYMIKPATGNLSNYYRGSSLYILCH